MMFWWMTARGRREKKRQRHIQKRLHDIYTGNFGSIGLGLLLASGTRKGLSERGKWLRAWYDRNYMRLQRIEYGYPPFKPKSVREMEHGQ